MRIFFSLYYMKGTLSQGQKYFRVVYLGLCFMIMYIAYDSAYREQGYDGLGQISLIVVYAFYGGFSFIASPIIKRLNYKKSMFFSSIGFILYSLTGLILTYWPDLPQYVGYIIVIVGAALCGIAVSVIWIAQGVYVAQICDQHQKAEFFGLFYAILLINLIIGNIITTFILGLINQISYFLILTSFGFISTIMFLFLPNLERKTQVYNINKSESIVQEETNKIFSLIVDKKNIVFMVYQVLIGVSNGFYLTYLYKIIVESLPGQYSDETSEDYDKRLYYYEGLVFIAMSVAQTLCGVMENRIGERVCRFKKAFYSTIIFVVAAIASLVNEYVKSYELCYLIAILWGGISSYLMAIVGVLVSQIFPHDIQSGFSAYNFCFALGLVVIVLINLLLQNQSNWIILILMFQIGLFYMYVGYKLGQMKRSETQNRKVGIFANLAEEKSQYVENDSKRENVVD